MDNMNRQQILDIQDARYRQLQARVAELETENARLSALCDKWNTECDEYREDNKRCSNELLLAQAEIKRLREDEELLVEAWNYGQFADDFNQPQAKPVRAAIRRLCEAIAQPSDTSALDAYVADKVKEAKPNG